MFCNTGKDEYNLLLKFLAGSGNCIMYTCINIYIYMLITFGFPSCFKTMLTRSGIVPASTTVWANSRVCLLISHKADAPLCIRQNSDERR